MNIKDSTKLLAVALFCASMTSVVPQDASALTEKQCKSQNSIYKRAVSTERRAISKFDREVRKLDSVVRRYERDIEKKERDDYKCVDKINDTEYSNQRRLDNEERKRAAYLSKAAGLTAQALQCGFGFFSSRSCNADRYQAQANRLLQQAIKVEARIPQIRDQNDKKLQNVKESCIQKAAQGSTKVARALTRVEVQTPLVDRAAVARDAAIALRVAKENDYNQCLATPPPAQ